MARGRNGKGRGRYGEQVDQRGKSKNTKTTKESIIEKTSLLKISPIPSLPKRGISKSDSKGDKICSGKGLIPSLGV